MCYPCARSKVLPICPAVQTRLPKQIMPSFCDRSVRCERSEAKGEGVSAAPAAQPPMRYTGACITTPTSVLPRQWGGSYTGASVSEAISSLGKTRDCHVAYAPRNDDQIDSYCRDRTPGWPAYFSGVEPSFDPSRASG